MTELSDDLVQLIIESSLFYKTQGYEDIEFTAHNSKYTICISNFAHSFLYFKKNERKVSIVEILEDDEVDFKLKNFLIYNLDLLKKKKFVGFYMKEKIATGIY